MGSNPAVTNAHVVEGCKSIDVNGKLSATIKANDPINDIAVISVSTPISNYLHFSPSSRPKVGATLVTMGYPLGDVLGANPSMYTGNLSSYSGLMNDVRMMQISVPIQNGNSGGPVVDNQGHVVGIVVSSLNSVEVYKMAGSLPQNVNFAIKGSMVKTFLEESNVQYEHAEPTPELTVPEIAEIISKSVVKINCLTAD